MDGCNGLLGKQASPPLTHLTNVPHHKVRVEPLYQHIGILVLSRVWKVFPVRYFCPLDTDRANTVGALGAGTMHSVVDHW